MKHFAPPSFWKCYDRLPSHVQSLADKNFRLLKLNPTHPSLQFKKVGRYRSVRVGARYRSLAIEAGEDIVWFWIGSHAKYDKIINA